MNKRSYGAHVSCCRQGCRQPPTGWGGLKWAAMSWPAARPSSTMARASVFHTIMVIALDLQNR